MRRQGAAILTAVAICLLGVAGGGPAEASAKRGKFSFGVIPQQGLTGKDFKTMRKGGIRSLRVALYWPQIEPEQGTMDWSAFDALVRKAAKRRVRLLPYLYGSPAWAARFDGHPCVGDCTKYAPSGDGTRAAFAFFASEAVRQYGPGGRFWVANPEVSYRPIDDWQVWNEQNSAKYFAPEPDVDSYAALLSTTSAAIKSVDPKANVMLGGMWGPKGSNDVIPTARYLKRFYRREGARASFDSLAVHPYAASVRGVLDQIGDARKVAVRSGDRRAALWVTELGWASRGPGRHHLVKGRRGQARILGRAYEALLERRREWRLRGAYWYAWKDTPSEAGFICLWCPGAGLLGVSGKPKPAWREMRSLARRR